jgi:hypothetical protein
MLLLALAIAATCAFQLSLRRSAPFWDESRRGGRLLSVAALGIFLLWCAIVVAGRLIAYLQVS